LQEEQSGNDCLIKQREEQIAKTLMVAFENSYNNQSNQTHYQVSALKTELSHVKAETYIKRKSME
jgi:hypothetical protein